MRLEATLSLAVRVAFGREPSAATTTAERPGAIPRVEAPASEALAVAAAFVGAGMVAAGGGNHRFVMLPVEREVQRWR
jgi:hypothetical protein